MHKPWISSVAALLVVTSMSASMFASTDARAEPELVLPSGHSPSKTLSVSPDGKLAVTGGLRDNVVNLWDVQTRRFIRRLATGRLRLGSVDALPDNTGALVAFWGEPLRAFDWSGRVLREAGFNADSAVIAPNGKTFAAIVDDGVRIGSLSTLVATPVTKLEEARGATFSPRGDLLFVRRSEDAVLVDVASKRVVRKI
jgi:WD40 repeat protein